MHNTPQHPPKQMLLALVGALLLISLFQRNLDPYDTRRTASQQQIPEISSRSLGREIVDRAYHQTYKHLVESCANNATLMRCMKVLHKSPTEYPWWFETLIRDGSDRAMGLQGPWHYNVLTTPTHKIQFCNIEKTASSEWKVLQCKLENRTGMCQGGKVQPEDPRAVFLRDPLERFLSGFIDKCINLGKREREHHCEPSEIFSPGPDEDRHRRRRSKESPPMVVELETNNRIFFDAYMDTLPLKWNVHFYPSSLYCNGLFRTVTNYDFVGHMGPDFHDNLRQFGHRYNMQSQVENVFNLPPLNATSVVSDEMMVQRNSRYNLNRTGSASKRIKEYYTPRTLRRALEYLSIDYAASGLDLPIPDWVDEMLEEEVREGLSPRAVA